MPPAVGALVVVTTVGTEEEANQLAEELVARRHSACVNIVPVHRSVYRWQGQIQSDDECLMIIKTTEGSISALREWILKRHPYELP